MKERTNRKLRMSYVRDCKRKMISFDMQSQQVDLDSKKFKANLAVMDLLQKRSETFKDKHEKAAIQVAYVGYIKCEMEKITGVPVVVPVVMPPKPVIVITPVVVDGLKTVKEIIAENRLGNCDNYTLEDFKKIGVIAGTLYYRRYGDHVPESKKLKMPGYKKGVNRYSVQDDDLVEKATQMYDSG